MAVGKSKFTILSVDSILEIVEKTGGIVSCIVIICVSVLELLLLSVAVQIIIVSPSGNVVGALLVIVRLESILSVAVAVPICIVLRVVSIPTASNVLFVGATTTGAISSIDVILAVTVTITFSTSDRDVLSVANTIACKLGDQETFQSNYVVSLC